jgi:hypothetical protein
VNQVKRSDWWSYPYACRSDTRSTGTCEGMLDLAEHGRIRYAAEAEPGDVVERRALLGEARHAAGNRDHEARRVCPAAPGGLAGLRDELRLDPLDW